MPDERSIRGKISSSNLHGSERQLRNTQYCGTPINARKLKNRNTIPVFDMDECKKIAAKNIEAMEKVSIRDHEGYLLTENQGDITEVTSKTVSAEENTAKSLKQDFIVDELLQQYDFCVFEEQLYIYREEQGFWKIIQESEANRELRKLIFQMGSSRVNKTFLYETYEWLLVRAQKIKGNTDNQNYLNFLDFALDWQSGEEITNRKELFFRYALQVNRKEFAAGNTSKFRKFVNETLLGDEETIHEFKKFVGLALSDIRDLKLCFFLYGQSNTGKSVFLNVLKGLVGEEWCASLSFTQMSNEFAITQLLGKRINLSGEVSGASNKRLDIFKSLTGNDLITACFKGKDHFQFQNRSLLVFACNSFPPVQSVDEFDSFLSRIIIFPFDNVVSREKWESKLEEKLLLCKTEIIAFAIEGLRLLEEDNYEFIESNRMKASKREFVGRYNSFEIFAQTHVKIDLSSITTSAEIRKHYREFCEENDYIVQEDNVWTQYLKQKFRCIPTTIQETVAFEYKRCRAYKGVRLINVSEEKEEIE